MRNFRKSFPDSPNTNIYIFAYLLSHILSLLSVHMYTYMDVKVYMYTILFSENLGANIDMIPFISLHIYQNQGHSVI